MHFGETGRDARPVLAFRPRPDGVADAANRPSLFLFLTALRGAKAVEAMGALHEAAAVRDVAATRTRGSTSAVLTFTEHSLFSHRTEAERFL
jgi:hypothetical protein